MGSPLVCERGFLKEVETKINDDLTAFSQSMTIEFDAGSKSGWPGEEQRLIRTKRLWFENGTFW